MHFDIKCCAICYRLIYWKEIATKFTINKSRKNAERHLTLRSTTQNLCHLNSTLPTKLLIPCHTATNGAQIRRTQILTSPVNGQTYRISSGRSLPRCPRKNFLVLRPVKMREEFSGELKQQHNSLTKHIDLAQRRAHRNQNTARK